MMMMMMMMMMNCFCELGDLEAAGAVFLLENIVSKRSYRDFPARWSGNRYRIAETAIRSAITTPSCHSMKPDLF